MELDFSGLDAIGRSQVAEDKYQNMMIMRDITQKKGLGWSDTVRVMGVIMEKYSQLVQGMIMDGVSSAFDEMTGALEDIESPIEQALYLAFINSGYKTYLYRYAKRVVGCDTVAFLPQHPIEIQGKTYRPDFLLSMWLPDDSTLHIAIECDGHDFHEKTKEQAKRDRQRERALTADGYIVVRFTGSEIFNDPYKCAEEIYCLAITKLKQMK